MDIYTEIYDYKENRFRLEDLSVWSIENDYGIRYHIGIEGLIYYETLNDAIEYYKIMLNEYQKWLTDNNVQRTEHNIKHLFKSQDIEIGKLSDESEYYINTYAPSFSELYDTYWWLFDVIQQLENIDI